MAIYTKLGHHRIEHLRADESCYQDRELVQVWTVIQGEHTEVKRFVSDLVPDRGLNEILDVVRANSKSKAIDPRQQVLPL
jgi:hypothetical protein